MVSIPALLTSIGRSRYSQMSLWCLFASNLMLGSDLRNISNTTLAIIGTLTTPRNNS